MPSEGDDRVLPVSLRSGPGHVRTGRRAFERHVAALQQIIARSGQDADARPADAADRSILGR
jgi:hypothetical protein